MQHLNKRVKDALILGEKITEAKAVLIRNKSENDCVTVTYATAMELCELIKELASYDYRTAVIEEICTEYYGVIVAHYKHQQRTDPNIGRYAFEKKIEFLENHMRNLKKQEWVKK